MHKNLSYDPILIVQILQIKPPREPHDQHYLMHHMKKYLQEIRKIYDYQAGQNLIEMLEVRQGILKKNETLIPYQDQQVCWYRPQTINKSNKKNKTQQDSFKFYLKPVRQYEQFYWIFVIQGQIIYKQLKYQSGTSFILDSDSKNIQEGSSKVRQHSLLAVLHKSNCQKLQKMKFLRERKRQLNFLGSSIFEPMKLKRLIQLHNKLSIIKLNMNQNPLTIIQEDSKINKQINYNSKSLLNTHNSNFKDDHTDLKERQSSIKVLTPIYDQKAQKIDINICLLTAGCAFAGKKAYQQLIQSTKMVNLLINLKIEPYKRQQNNQRENPQEYYLENSQQIQKPQQQIKNQQNQYVNYQIQFNESYDFNYLCNSDNAEILAIPVHRFFESPICQYSQIRINLLKMLEERVKRAKQMIQARKQKKGQSLRRQKWMKTKITKNLLKKSISVPKIFEQCQKHYQVPSPQRNIKRMPNLLINLFDLSKPQVKQNPKITKSATKLTNHKYRTISISAFEADTRSTTMQQEKKVKKIQNVQSVNSLFKQFFVPQQFVSKKLKIQYEGVLSRMRKKQIDFHLSPSSKEKENPRDYVYEYINQRRVIKLPPRKKFLPIYNDPKKALQLQHKMKNSKDNKDKKINKWNGHSRSTTPLTTI